MTQTSSKKERKTLFKLKCKKYLYKSDISNFFSFVKEVNGMMQTAATEVSKQGEVVGYKFLLSIL